MFGLFTFFGRSREYRRLDDALNNAGLVAAAIPDAVKLTILRLLKEEGGTGEENCARAAHILAYCLLGSSEYAEYHGAQALAELDRVCQAAPDNPEALEVRIIILTLHSGLAHEQVQERFSFETQND
ncbi:hypothetical protein [Fodinicurvata fenggangensis]|uniref:hypothetical protein n=1 Tax=Fodinicurvata fenggangensis TaxID=1121830 RepID=UPI00047E2464|nr:hypothetical protein [Fodinicurvata fenggangensis]